MNRIEKRIRTTEQARLRSDVYDALKIRGPCSARCVKYELEDRYIDLKVKHVSSMLVKLKGEGLVAAVKGRNDINVWSVIEVKEEPKVEAEVKVKLKLKPCPFCGVIPTLEENNGLYRVSCRNMDGCKVCVHIPWSDGKMDVIEWWNRRMNE